MNWNTNRPRSAKTIAKELLSRRMAYTPWSEGQTKAERERMEKDFDEHFKRWFDSWIRPGLEEIVDKGTPKPELRPGESNMDASFHKRKGHEVVKNEQLLGRRRLYCRTCSDFVPRGKYDQEAAV